LIFKQKQRKLCAAKHIHYNSTTAHHKFQYYCIIDSAIKFQFSRYRARWYTSCVIDHV